jgi:hypothetical protein
VTDDAHDPLGPTAHQPARLVFEQGHFRVLRGGAFVLCAVTGARIAIDDLRYWSVERQEPYADPEAAFRREQAARAEAG